MKRIFSLLLLCLALCLLLCGCKKALKVTSSGTYLSSDGTVYRPAPLCYEAVGHGEKADARIRTSAGETALYELKNGCLTTESYLLYVPEGVSLPTLPEFSPDRLDICKSDSVTVSIANTTDRELLSSLVASASAPSIDAEDGIGNYTRYLLKFSSAAYPEIYYCLEYRVYEEEVTVSYPTVTELTVPMTTETYAGEKLYTYHLGKNLFFDRETERLIPAGTLLDALLGGTQDE